MHEQAKLLRIGMNESFFHHDKPSGLLRIFGEDAEDYLQSQVTVNVRKLTAGCVNVCD